ncbi:Uracil DNA glycosylase superfamily protein [Sporomusa ovata DSM 2662]|uniref:Type-4 uracil-DNA glycosylase n=1 Tax=Sporomusa ovata TaxID=2378 RepID=A0A0U1L052_9FIRM|nr:uracil-DNA glycosylase [Sporomusa ovata]EQB27200.1 uracil-DNA glycosylase [Sporomusa ovata DSM 2662]CQR73041.1 Uracil-DNA glycosylase, family 4 [Sporomusa ovata]
MFSSISDLESALLSCDQCKLCQENNHGPTSYNGSACSPLAIIGEGPGGVEDEYGVPLVGPSGQLLDKALWSVGVTRDKAYTSNVIKCRPNKNRTPTVEEGEFCASLWLDKEIAIIQPKVIIALGSVALKYLLAPTARITKDRGHWFTTKYNIPAIATYHPAYLLRLTGKDLVKAKWEVYYDMKAAVEKCQELAPGNDLKSETIPNLLELYNERKISRLSKNSL